MHLFSLLVCLRLAGLSSGYTPSRNCENGPLATDRLLRPPLPITSPRLRRLRPRDRACRRASSFAFALSLSSSWRASTSLDASSLRTFLGRNRAALGPRVALVVAAPRVDVAEDCMIGLVSASSPSRPEAAAGRLPSSPAEASVATVLAPRPRPLPAPRARPRPRPLSSGGIVT
jgi:hypothetical protein